MSRYFATFGGDLWHTPGSVSTLTGNRENVVDTRICRAIQAWDCPKGYRRWEKAGLYKVYQVPAQRKAPKRCQKQPEAGSYDNGLAGAYISAQIACGYVLHPSNSAKCIFTFDVAILCRDPRLSAQRDIITAIDQFDQRVELHYIQACQISGRFRAQP